ncbi:phage portal protein [Sulfitobacter sp. MOLA879]|uniref:phage portal protein n=1 Tax=Sulfitobacter sp. MOLA879 TaxID=3368579 RepID=UPI003745B7B4
MNILSGLLKGSKPARAARVEPVVASAPVTSGTREPNGDLFNIGYGSGQSRVRSLPRVTGTIAQRHATVFACANNIAGDHSKVPLKMFQRDGEGGETRVREHPAAYLMNVEASPGVSARVLRFALVYAFCIRGRAHGYSPRDGGGELELIEAINPDHVSMFKAGRSRVFDFEDGAGVRRRVPARSMVNLRYMPEDGWTGRSPTEVAGESFGLALAGQEAAARTASGATMRAVIKMEDSFEDDEAYRRNGRRIRNALTDPENEGFPIIGGNDSIDSLDLSAADQELLSSRKFDREQIAAVYRMPPSKLQMLEYGVKANGEQQAIDYLTDCLMHWSSLIEAEYAMGLLTESERRSGLFFRHDFGALLQATTKEKYDALTKAVGGPIMTANTAQRIANLPVTDGADDNRLNPAANMTRDPSKEE